MMGNLTNTKLGARGLICGIIAGSTSKFSVKVRDEKLSLDKQRVLINLSGSSCLASLDMSRNDALALARGILSTAGFILDGAPV